MKERPILFKGELVRAILEGRKTQTRRVVKPQPEGIPELGGFGRLWFDGREDMTCPFGQPGDRLWVRETFSPVYSSVDGRLIEVDYRASYEHGHRMGDHMGIAKVWKPSIHMPREACRLVLEITDVRVERLQAISEADAMAEGAEPILVPPDGGSCPHVEGFRELWTSTGGDWDANPWVWVIGFKQVTA